MGTRGKCCPKKSISCLTTALFCWKGGGGGESHLCGLRFQPLPPVIATTSLHLVAFLTLWWPFPSSSLCRHPLFAVSLVPVAQKSQQEEIKEERWQHLLSICHNSRIKWWDCVWASGESAVLWVHRIRSVSPQADVWQRRHRTSWCSDPKKATSCPCGCPFLTSLQAQTNPTLSHTHTLLVNKWSCISNHDRFNATHHIFTSMSFLFILSGTMVRPG